MPPAGKGFHAHDAARRNFDLRLVEEGDLRRTQGRPKVRHELHTCAHFEVEALRVEAARAASVSLGPIEREVRLRKERLRRGRIGTEEPSRY